MIDPQPDRFLTALRVSINTFIDCKTARYLLLSGLLLVGIFAKTEHTYSQVRLGVQWNPPQDTTEFNRQLTILKTLGITKLQLVPPITRYQLQRLEALNSPFQLFIHPPFSFVIGDDPQFTPSYLADTLSRFVRKFDPYSQISAIGLLDRSELYDDNFARIFFSVAERLVDLTDKKLFVISAFPPSKHPDSQKVVQIADSLHIHIQLAVSYEEDIRNQDSLFSYIYFPKNVSVFEKRKFRGILDSLLKKEEIPDLFITGSWLSERLSQNSGVTDKGIDIAELIRRYQKDDHATFEINEPVQQDALSLDWPVFLLIIIFGSFAFHLSYSNVYRNCLFRYFRTHMFFVDDIAKRHIRTSIPGYVILVQHILSTCIILYLLFVSVFDEIGWQVILHYFPALNPLYNTLPFIIIPTAFLALAIESFIILLIYLTNKSVKHLNQVFLLYCWPLQIGIVIAAVALLLELTDFPPFYLLIMVFLFVVNWLGSFILSVVDISLFTKDRKTLFITINTGFFLVIISLLIYFVSTRNILDITWLALKLSGS